MKITVWVVIASAIWIGLAIYVIGDNGMAKCQENSSFETCVEKIYN